MFRDPLLKCYIFYESTCDIENKIIRSTSTLLSLVVSGFLRISINLVRDELKGKNKDQNK